MASIGVDIQSLGYDIAQDRYYIYADGEAFDYVLNKSIPMSIRNGYKCVSFYFLKAKRMKHEYVHRLIGKAFVYNPKRLPCINHIDGDKQNNSVANLEWCDKSKNNKHAYRTGLRSNGRGGGHNAPIMCIETGEIFNSITQASEKCKIGRSSIQDCLSGRNKTCLGAHWKYI